jgi:peptide deformylase
MILPILKITGEDSKPLVVLRQTSAEVTDFNDELRRLVASMIETLLATDGFGLSAPQVGRHLNLFVMRTHAGIMNRNREVRVVINPDTIVEVGEDVSTAEEKIESCLSIPGVVGRVARWHEVRCVYRDENGRSHNQSLKGMDARIYQHERDHLVGKLFVDLANEFYREPEATSRR